jgi:hypothetical protein
MAQALVLPVDSGKNGVRGPAECSGPAGNANEYALQSSVGTDSAGLIGTEDVRSERGRGMPALWYRNSRRRDHVPFVRVPTSCYMDSSAA